MSEESITKYSSFAVEGQLKHLHIQFKSTNAHLKYELNIKSFGRPSEMDDMIRNLMDEKEGLNEP